MSPVGQPWTAPDTPSEPRRPVEGRAPVVTTAVRDRRRGLRDSPVERLQPRGLWSILDGGFEVMRFRFGTIAAFSAIVVLPLAGIPALIAASHVGSRLDDTRSVPAATLGTGINSNSRTFQLLVSGLGSAIALALVGVGITYLVTGWLIGEDHTLGDTLRHVGRRSWVVAVAWLAVLPLKVLGVFACLVGVLFVLGAFLPLSAVVSAEALGPFASIGRCRRLARRHLGSLAGLTVIMIVLTFALESVAAGIVVVIRDGAFSDASWSWAITAALTIAFRLVLTPIQAAWAALAYLDLRVRSEGLDLELEASELFGEVS
jgi:MFS family permease